MKRWIKRFAFGAAVLAVAGVIVVGLGLVPIAASEGHWRSTAWLLHFAMRQSVQTQSLGIKVPPLDDPSLVLRGAGHYESGCAPCHGAPGAERSPIVRQMTPTPPFLPPKISEWTPQQLFWIVKNGIKYTGMPGWVAQQREDEVWAVTAFLQRLPELTPEEYRRLAIGEPAVGPAVTDGGNSRLRGLSEPVRDTLATCARCHEVDGTGRGTGAFPRLAGQHATYLYGSLLAYAAGERHSGIMQPIAAGLSEEMMRELAAYFAAIDDDPVGETEVLDAAALERGKRVATTGIPERGVPACIECHGPTETVRKHIFPKLAGQYAEYIGLQLRLFKEGKRGGTPYAHIMHQVASRLEQEEMRAVALYFAALDDD